MYKALVVDDNTDNLYLLQALLVGNGYIVATASNGEEALTRALELLPDLIISDILMPGMDGFALCRVWKQDPRLRGIPFIFYTATYTDQRDEQFALSLGADMFIVKPSEPDVFLKKIGEMLSRHRAGSLPNAPEPNVTEQSYLKEYNQVLIQKLEQKLIQLEDTNRALATREAFGQAVLNSVMAQVAVVDGQGVLVAANDAWKTSESDSGAPRFVRLGVGENLLQKCRMEEAARSPGIAEIVAGVQSVLESKAQTFSTEFVSHGTSVPRWYVVRVAHLGAPSRGAVISCFEVTDRVRAELHSRATKTRFHGLFEAIRDVIFLFEADQNLTSGNLVELNGAAERVLGYSKKDLLDMSMVAIQERVAPAFQQIWEELKQKDNILLEHILLAENGQEIPVETQAYKVAFSDHRSIFTISHDLRERKRAEDERMQLEKQLRHAQKMEAVGLLAGGVAHDFNNLLQAIGGYSELAEHSLDQSTSAAEYLQEVQKAALRAGTLVRQLLTFSRRDTMQKEWVHINTLISDLSKMVRRLIGEHIELSFRAADDLPRVYADAGQIEQILVNLCVNARDAMPEGGRLLVETEYVVVDKDYALANPAARQGHYVVFSVSDTGCGIPPDIRDRVFEPFFTTKGAGEGTGLGLSTVYAITQRHEGFLSLYSEIGCGSTFRIHLPAQPDPHFSGDTPSDKGRAGDLSGHGEVVLLAEDDPQVRELTLRILEDAGYSVLVARDGEEAIQLLSRNADRIDIALLDVIMPKKNGRAVYEAIRAQGNSMPVLLTSGYSENMLGTNYLPDADFTLLHKPYRKVDLLRRLQECLERR